MYDYEYPPLGGGGGVSHHLIASELAKRHEVTVVTSGQADLPAREVLEGVQVHRIRVWGRNERAVASLRSLLTYPPSAWVHATRGLDPGAFDIINSHFAVPTGPASLVIARRYRLPHVLSIHGGDIFDPSKRLSPHRFAATRRVVREVLRRSDAVVAQSKDTRDNARRIYGEELDIEIIPLAVRVPDTVPPATREDLGLPTNVFLGITVGRLVARKAIDLLITALSRPGCTDVHLLVVGEGPEQPALERLAGELGLSNRIHFAGRVPETTKWQMLQASDAYLSSTMHEGYGLVFLEAMAMGLPVVAPDRGGHMDFLEDGCTGLVTASGDVDALARAVSRLAADPVLVRDMGATNVTRFDRDHRLAITAARYEALFERLASRVPRPAEALLRPP